MGGLGWWGGDLGVVGMDGFEGALGRWVGWRRCCCWFSEVENRVGRDGVRKMMM